MKRLTYLRPIASLVGLVALSLVLAACSPSAARLTKDGNAAYAKQAYEQALQSYQTAQARSPELAEPYYNAANALYRQGKYEDALKELEKAAQIAQADAVAENSFFNMGNSAYNIQSWEPAIESYKQALLRDPNDQDAKHNLELALKQLQQQQQQQRNNQQNEQQNQQNQNQQDQQNQNQQNQNQQDQQNQGQQDQQNQDQQNQDQQNQKSDQGQQDQQNQDQQDQQPGDKQGDQQSENGQPQDQAGQQPDQQQQQGQAQSQPSGEQQNRQQRPGMQLAPGQRMTADQAKQLLAAIARNSDTLQGRLGQILKVQSRPPVQDW